MSEPKPSSKPAPAAAANSDDAYLQAKSALVSSLCELSTAATQTATAALNFYKFAGAAGQETTSASESLQKLSDSLLSAAKTTSASIPNGSASTQPKKAPAKTQKKKDTVAAVEKAAAPKKSAPEPAPQTVTENEAAAILDDLSTTDPALLKASAPSVANIAAAAVAAVADKPEKPKKKRAEKDPNAPKKPVTSYLRFNLAVREQLRGERKQSGSPTLQATELNQIISERWANLGEAEKQKLQKAYEADYEVYKKALDEYKANKNADASRKIADSPAAAEDVTHADADAKADAKTDFKTDANNDANSDADAKTEASPVPAASKAAGDSPAATSKPKKKKKAKKAAGTELPEAAGLESVEAVAAAATEAAKAAIASDKAQEVSKPSKKRKDKDSSEKSAKKKKSE